MKLVHERNIIHRNISPDNVLIIGDKIYISDFGLGKDSEIFHSHKTVLTNAHGQLAYCAPEQFMQLKDGDMKSDVFSLGRLINYVIAGHPADKRHFLRSICEKAHSTNSNMRYQSSRELYESLLKAIAYEKESSAREVALGKIESVNFDEDVEIITR